MHYGWRCLRRGAAHMACSLFGCPAKLALTVSRHPDGRPAMAEQQGLPGTMRPLSSRHVSAAASKASLQAPSTCKAQGARAAAAARLQE